MCIFTVLLMYFMKAANDIPLQRIMKFCIMLYHIVSCRVVSCRVVSCRVVSCRVVSCRVVSCRVVSCRVLLYSMATTLQLISPVSS